MEKKCRGILLFFLMLLCMPVSVHASTVMGSRATGASLPVYREVVERRLDQNDISQGLKDALAEAGKYATDEKQYKIVISPGQHRLQASDGASEPYYIPSNVWIYARDAVIDVTCKKMFMTRGGIEEPFRNIKIEGGTYRQSGDAGNVSTFMLLRLSHIQNMEILDAKFQVKRRTHILELGDVIGLTVSGCTFSGNNSVGNDPPSDYVQPKEAIQIDVATEKALPGQPPYDGSGSHNVVVKNNTFLNVARGVGSHNNGTEMASYTDITIRNNVFRNLTGEAVHAMHWRNATIRNNTIVNAHHAGVILADCKYCLVSVNEIRNLKPYTGLRKKRYDSFGGIILNSSTKNCTVKNNVLSGSNAKAVVRKSEKKQGNQISGNRKK